jgi:trans-aconitate methyltransferase
VTGDTDLNTDRDYFAAVAKSYDRLQPVIAGPSYQAGLDLVLVLVPREPEDAFAVVELGCGTAELTRRLLDRFPRARAVAIDSEPAMLEIARQKLLPYEDRVELREADVLACDLPPCDLVLSSFLFHHVPPDSLHAILSRIAGALSPSGCLILLDTMQVGPRWSERVGALSRRLYQRHVAAAIAAGAATQAEVDARWAFKRTMKDEGRDVEYRHSAERLLETIHEAGFDEAGLVWRMFASTVLVGFVPK